MSSDEISRVKLESPGAGLPAFELAWLRICFRCACVVTSQNTAMRRFRREADRIVSLARNTPATQGTFRVLIDRITGIEDSSRDWSVFMVLDHLCIVDEVITRIIEDLSNNRPFAKEVRIEDVKPHVDTGPDAINRFIRLVATYEATINRLGKSARSVRHSHPWFGSMTAQEWHCLAGLHHGVHRRQIEQIKVALRT